LRRAWAKATKTAGVPHLHFHDLCRFAARNLDSAGVPQLATESIYKHYRIVTGAT